MDEADVEMRVLVVNRGLVEELIIVVKFNLVLDANEVKLVCWEDEEKSLIEEAAVDKFAPNVGEVSEDKLVTETGDDALDKVL